MLRTEAGARRVCISVALTKILKTKFHIQPLTMLRSHIHKTTKNISVEASPKLFNDESKKNKEHNVLKNICTNI